MANDPQPMGPVRQGVTIGGALLALVGGPTFALLMSEIPREESGRTVTVTVSPQTATAVVRHISGRQYLKVYLDMVGVPTACDGLTGRQIRLGMAFTEQQCATMLADSLADTAAHVMTCTPGLALSVPGRNYVRFAAVSLAHNIGWPTYCRSTMRSQINAGQINAACASLTWFNRAGGHVVRGLADRRAREAVLCRKDAV